MDVNGAKVIAGRAIKGRKGYGVRVLWNDGTLYVVTTVNDVLATPCPEEPKKHGSAYRAAVEGSMWTIQLPTCGCKRDPMLGKMSQEQIIALAEGAMIDA